MKETNELSLIESLEQILQGSELEQLLNLKQSLGELALQSLLELEDWLDVVDRSVLDEEIDCQDTIERLTRLRATATGQTCEEVLAYVVHRDKWQERMEEMKAQDAFPSWVDIAPGTISMEIADGNL